MQVPKIVVYMLYKKSIIFQIVWQNHSNGILIRQESVYINMPLICIIIQVVCVSRLLQYS